MVGNGKEGVIPPAHIWSAFARRRDGKEEEIVMGKAKLGKTALLEAVGGSHLQKFLAKQGLKGGTMQYPTRVNLGAAAAKKATKKKRKK